MADVSEVITFDGLTALKRQLDSLLSSDPRMEAHLRGVVRKVLMEARDELSSGASSGLQMKSDPREAYRAVRSLVYRQLLGGNVNILSRRRAGELRVPASRAPRVGRGGNRMPVSEKTKRMESYMGADRGFVLRWLNEGTGDRAITGWGSGKGRKNLLSGGVSVMKTKSLGGNRGSITGRHWFGSASHRSLMNAAERLSKMVDAMIERTAD